MRRRPGSLALASYPVGCTTERAGLGLLFSLSIVEAFLNRYNMLMVFCLRSAYVKFALVVISLLSVLSFSVPVFAQDACDITATNDPLICGEKNSNEEAALQQKVKSVLDTVYLWVGIIAVIVIVIGGVRYMTSTGDANKIQGAKRTITYSVVGLVVTIAAFAITEFVIDALDGKTPSETVAESDSGGGSAGGGAVEVKSVQILGLSTMARKTEYSFSTKIVPDYATNRTVTWKSSNPKVATVSKTGRVKAIKPGQTTITATASNGKTSQKVVTVPEPIVVSEVSISAPASISTADTKTQLNATVLPKNSENQKLTWSLNQSGQEIASISQKGLLKLKKDGKGKYKTGTVKVTAKAASGVKDTVAIAVKDKEEDIKNDRIEKLQATVKKYAWEYCNKTRKIYKYCITQAKTAYKHAARKYKTGNGNIFDNWANGIAGSACVSYVITVMRDSGWDPNFVVGSVKSGAVIRYFRKASSGWHNITSKLSSRSIKPEPGDVIIHYGGSLNHILLYSGKIDGFISTTTSASLGGWVPRSDNYSIWSYINQGYSVWRYIPKS